jgi:hypothetical protein
MAIAAEASRDSQMSRVSPVFLLCAFTFKGLAFALTAAETRSFPTLIVHTSVHSFTNRDKLCAKVFYDSSTFSDGHRVNRFVACSQIHLRGASSTQFPKRSFALELQDSEGNDKKIEMCGLPAESDWVLYASYTDKTFVRDALVYELWHALGYWAPRTRYIELIITTNNVAATAEWLQWPKLQEQYCDLWQDMVRLRALGDPAAPPIWVDGYQGVYVLIEKIKRGKDRLNVRKLKPSDHGEPEITGGYVFKKDRLGPGEQGFYSQSKIRFTFVAPKEPEITDPQRGWLTNYINKFEVALFGSSIGVIH